MRFLPGNAQDIGGRSEQQDSFGFSDLSDHTFAAHGGVVAVLADGMGGLAHGSAASQTAIHSFLQAYQSKDPTESIPEALVRSIQVANEAVANLALDAAAKDQLGTTLAAAAIDQDGLYWISVGDSRVYLYRNGKIAHLTIDHVYANDLDEQVARGLTTQLLAQGHPERASLTSYLGLASIPKIDRSLKPFPVQPGDWALVCSDGLYRSLSEDKIAAALRGDATRSCEVLIQQALAANDPAQDNMTVLVLKCERDGLISRVAIGKAQAWKSASLVVAAVLGVAAMSFAWFEMEQPHQRSDSASAAPSPPIQSAVSSLPKPAAPALVQPLPPALATSTPQASKVPASLAPVKRSAATRPGKTAMNSPEAVRPKDAVRKLSPLEIQNFDAVPDADAFKLRWTLSGANSENCKLSIADENGGVVSAELPRSGHEGIRVAPLAATKYILTAVCGNKTLSQSVTASPKPSSAN